MFRIEEDKKELKKTVMSSFDIKCVLDELQNLFKEKRIKNIYQLRGNLFLIKVTPGQLDLLIELERRIHLTKYKLTPPLKPPNFCMELRKHLRNGIIQDISQHEFERIVILDIKTKQGVKYLTVEIFKRGNMILLDNKYKIITAFYFAELRDRTIKRGETFKYPPSTGIHPSLLTTQHIEDIIREAPRITFEKALSKILPYPRIYIQEALVDADIDGEKEINAYNDEMTNNILPYIKDIYNKHVSTEYKAAIIYNKEGEKVDVTPTPLKIYEQMISQKFTNFNEAVDEYFKDFYIESLQKPQINKLISEKERLLRIIKSQKVEAEKIKKQIIEHKIIAEMLKENAFSLGELLKDIHGNWKNKSVFSDLKSRNTQHYRKLIELILDVDYQNKRIQLHTDNIKFWIDISISPFKSASLHFDKTKVLASKLKRVIHLIEQSERQLTDFVQEVKEEPSQIELTTKKELKWYEKFRWFKSSEDILVISGRDASSNQFLIDKHMEPSDLVFHADIHGAPFTIVKKGQSNMSEDTITEAAIATASFSRAWREGLTALDVYWVNPHQVSKRPPSGEYLGRGMFMIYGSRNYLRGVNLNIAIGIELKDNTITIIGGPTSAIKKKSIIYIDLVPGYTPSGKIVKEIKNIFLKKKKEFSTAIKRIDLTDIQQFLPPGKSRIRNIGPEKGETSNIYKR